MNVAIIVLLLAITALLVIVVIQNWLMSQDLNRVENGVLYLKNLSATSSIKKNSPEYLTF